MRKVLYGVILALLFLVPVERTDVAKLLPIRAVAIYTEGTQVVLETDTRHKGMGADAQQALENLKENTAAVVYLDTAEYVLVSQGAEDYVEQIADDLKPSVKVAICNAAGCVEEIASYLDVHDGVTELRRWQTK